MVDYKYLIVDPTAGTPLAEVPLTVNSFSRILTGCGELSGSMPLDDAKATTAILGGVGPNNIREITVLRNEAVVWNGPITSIDANRRRGTIDITAREAFYWLTRDYIEVDRYYHTADVFAIVRDLISTGRTSKTGGSLYGWSTTTGSAGHTKTWAFSGRARYNVGESIIGLAQDPTTAFDFKMDYSTGSTRQQAHRSLVLGSPSLGVTQTALLIEELLYDYGFVHDLDRAANRVHVVGAKQTVTLQNSGSISGGDPLLEARWDRTDVTSADMLNGIANEARRLAIPPVKTYSVSYIPGTSLPYGWCDLGDTIKLAITDGYLAISDNRRVVQITTTPRDSDGNEVVELTVNLPLDQLGT